MKIFSIFKVFMQILACAGFFAYVFYLRLFRGGKIREIATDLLYNENYLRIIIIIYILISLLIALYMQIKSLYEIESKFKFKILNYFGEILENAFHTFFDKIDRFATKCGLRAEHLLKFGLFLHSMVYRKIHFDLLIYTIHVLSKFIYLVVFILDIFIWHKLYYAFIFSGLLLIPFLAKFVEKLYDYFTSSIFDKMDKMFFIEDRDTGKNYTPHEFFFLMAEADVAGVRYPVQYVFFVLKPEHEAELDASIAHLTDGSVIDYQGQVLKYYDAYFKGYVPLRIFTLLYLEYKRQITVYAHILFTLSYIIIWSSLLYITL